MASWNDYTSGMDSVRFGRALGMGARGAAKALAMAADAASSPNPGTPAVPARSASPQAGPETPPPAAARAGSGFGDTAARTTRQVLQTKAGIARGSKQFGDAVWAPFVKLSGVLWLELTGFFFGLFVLTATINAWKLRGNMHDLGANHTEHQHLLFSLAMAAVFGYFCASSFVRAGRRGRRGR